MRDGITSAVAVERHQLSPGCGPAQELRVAWPLGVMIPTPIVVNLVLRGDGDSGVDRDVLARNLGAVVVTCELPDARAASDGIPIIDGTLDWVRLNAKRLKCDGRRIVLLAQGGAVVTAADAWSGRQLRNPPLATALIRPSGRLGTLLLGTTLHPAWVSRSADSVAALTRLIRALVSHVGVHPS